jgi:hypothetical protein
MGAYSGRIVRGSWGSKASLFCPRTSILPKQDRFRGLTSLTIIIVTRIHLKRMESDYLALCGIRPRELFRLIDTVPKFTPLETDSVCKICLKAARGIEGQSSSATSGS